MLGCAVIGCFIVACTVLAFFPGSDDENVFPPSDPFNPPLPPAPPFVIVPTWINFTSYVYMDITRAYENETKDRDALVAAEAFNVTSVVPHVPDPLCPPYPYENETHLVYNGIVPSYSTLNITYVANITANDLDPLHLSTFCNTSQDAPFNVFTAYTKQNGSWIYFMVSIDGNETLVSGVTWLVNVWYRETSGPLFLGDTLVNLVMGLDANYDVILLCVYPMLVSCKPAIYLYPEEPIDATVELDIHGQVLVTNPELHDAWYVHVEPNGTITAGRESFEYLFYEADMARIFYPESGWVVSNGYLDAWFDTHLPLFGLNANEMDSFKGYWLSRLPGAPFYEIHLFDIGYLQEEATITIEPSPSTVIRVWLLFIPLEEPSTIENPAIVTPLRAGFTMVEWGGMILPD